jgi:hypothetical protein
VLLELLAAARTENMDVPGIWLLAPVAGRALVRGSAAACTAPGAPCMRLACVCAIAIFRSASYMAVASREIACGRHEQSTQTSISESRFTARTRSHTALSVSSVTWDSVLTSRAYLGCSR